ncbi:hypothetical protein H6F96_29460 [Microcoleus sp. FACHB-53]|nr:hypothetical protein [Microcoleus sp. FACHB-53]
MQTKATQPVDDHVYPFGGTDALGHINPAALQELITLYLDMPSKSEE